MKSLPPSQHPSETRRCTATSTSTSKAQPRGRGRNSRAGSADQKQQPHGQRRGTGEKEAEARGEFERNASLFAKPRPRCARDGKFCIASGVFFFFSCKGCIYRNHSGIWDLGSSLKGALGNEWG